MKLGLMKRVVATGLCAVMLLGDALPVAAAGSVSGGDAAVIEEVNTALAEKAQVKENALVGETVSGNDAIVALEPVTVDGVTITLTAPAGTIPEDTELWAEEIEAEEQIEVIDAALEAEAQENAMEIQKYKAFDIKILADGEEIQPTEDVTVTFAGDILLPQNEEEAVAVYHVTENAEVNDMEAVITADNEVEMETDHFSIYVIAVAGEAGTYNVTVQHRLAADMNANFYADEPLTVENNGKLQIGVKGGDAYNVVEMIISAEMKNAEGTLEDTAVTLVNGVDFAIEETELGDYINLGNEEPYKIKSDATVTLLYAPSEPKTVQSDVTYFDYNVIGPKTTVVTFNEGNENAVLGDVTYEYVGNGSDNRGDYQFRRRWSNQYFTIDKVIEEYNKNNSNKELTLLQVTNDEITLLIEDYSQLSAINTGINNPKYAIDKDGVYHGFTAENRAENGSSANGNSNYISMGQYGTNFPNMGHFADYSIKTTKEVVVTNAAGEQTTETRTLDVNWNNTPGDASDDGEEAIVPNIVSGLSGTQNSEVNFNYYQPGYFTSENLVSDVTIDNKTVYDKVVYDDRFQLNFDQNGYTWTLKSSIDTENNNKETTAGKDNATFFPLSDVERFDTATRISQINDSDTNQNRINSLKNHSEFGADGANVFFGMRYDFTFTLGDYIGPLEYTFVGDDDLWVFVDGERVLDLGGMHSAYPSRYDANGVETPEANTVDLWSVIDKNTEEYDYKTHPYQITVLYMERGSWDSTCYMEFVLPNAAPMESVVRKPADFELTKVDSVSREALENAVFELTKYNDDGSVDVSFADQGVLTVTSDENGKLKFYNIDAGSYNLKEKTAPSGYYLTADEWNVKAIADSKGNVSVSVRSKSGATVSVIENTPIEVVPDADKTATIVGDWEDRVFKIDLSATVNVQTIATANDAKVLLLMDTSTSMKQEDAVLNGKKVTRSAAVIAAAKTFVGDLPDETQVSVVTFGPDQTLNQSSSAPNILCDFTSLETENGRNDVSSALGNAVSNGVTGTNAYRGFNVAQGMFEELKNSGESLENCYIVYFTDGEDNKKNNAINAAATLKEMGIIIYAIGLGNETSYLQSVASDEDYAYVCSDMSEVVEALSSLGDVLPIDATVDDVVITDEITEYFELCDAEGNPITELEGATVNVDPDTLVTTITWEQDSMLLGTEWKKEIYVRARDEFAGGNCVPTNYDYKVTVDGKTKTVDSPKVNVYCGIKAGEITDTIFLGEDLTSYLTEEKQIAVSGAKVDKDGNITAIASTKGNYYTNFDYVNLGLVWKNEEGNVVDVNDIPDTKPTENTYYTTTLTVTPKYADDSTEALAAAEAMKKDDTLYTLDTLVANGKYTVIVISGQIDVTKKIKKSDIDFTDGDPIFTFQISNGNRTYTKMVRFTEAIVEAQEADENGYISLTTFFTNLEKGNYTLSELDTLNYKKESITVVDETNCVYEKDSTQFTAQFAIGKENLDSNTTELTATKGVAVYTNVVTDTPGNGDKDMLINQVVLENGKVVIKKVPVPVQN